MKRTRRKLFGLFLLLFFAAIVGVPLWLTYRDIHQQRLDRALIAAIKKQDTPKVIALLNEGANANARDVPRETRSFWQQMWDKVRSKSARTDTNLPTALWVHLNILRAKYDVIEAPPGYPHDSSTENFPLMYPPDNAADLQQKMAGEENALLLKALIKYGADVNVKDKDGAPPLFIALRCYYPISPHLLWSSTVNRNYRDSNGLNLLMWAVRGGFADIVQRLLDQGDNPNSSDENGVTALMYAHDPAIVRMLIAKGANINVKDSLGNTALILTSEMPIAEILLNEKANLETKDNDGNTALIFHAGSPYDIDVIKLLIRRGADKEVKNKKGETALLYACENGYTEIARCLIQSSANVNVRNFDNTSALQYAESTKVDSLVALLKKAGAKE